MFLKILPSHKHNLANITLKGAFPTPGSELQPEQLEGSRESIGELLPAVQSKDM